MLTWLTLVACSTPDPEAVPDPAPAEAPDAPDAGKAKTGKGKKGKKGKNGGKGKKGGKPGCPEGVVVNGGWEGEYPDPIVDVTEPVATTGRTEPCQRRATTACTVPAGLYHPWSDTDGDAAYQTVRAVERWKVLVDHELSGIAVTAGSEIVVKQYLAEGFCILVIEGTEVENHCPGVSSGDDDKYEKLEAVAFETRQLVQVACEGGDKLWIDGDALLTEPGVRPGKVLEYGKVGPGGD